MSADHEGSQPTEPGARPQAREPNQWDSESDIKLVNTVQQYQNRGRPVRWDHVAEVLHRHPASCERRYYRISRANFFTRYQEDELVDLATGYYDNNKEPDWGEIGRKLEKDPQACNTQYFKVMAEYWNDENTQQLVNMINGYKERQEKVDWRYIGQQLQGRPQKVCMQRYSKYLQMQKQK